jgi:hypothetical protein
MHVPDEFNEEVRKIYPVAFGPLEFSCKEGFDASLEIDKIVKRLTRDFPEVERACIHGLEVKVNSKRLRRGVQLLNHASNI